ncbi:MAG: hypothetical protein ABIQ95_13195 [Bdellovibrionia bacterium]
MKERNKDLRNRKGNCPICGLYRQLIGKGVICRPCAHPVMKCPKCGTVAKLHTAGLCGLCYGDKRARKYFTALNGTEKFASQYNSYLFELYLKTVHRRLRIRDIDILQAQYLLNVFESTTIPTIRSWSHIYELASKYPAPCRRGLKCCPWNKIGYMLFELGLLIPKAEDRCRQIQNHILKLGAENEPAVREFQEYLSRTNRAQSTQVGYLNNLLGFQLWLLKMNPNLNLLSVSRTLVETYLNGLSTSSRESAFWKFHSFYRFCKMRKWILIHPLDDLTPPPKSQKKLEILSEASIKQIIEFMKSPSSPPELAFLLALILFYGCTPAELTHAQITNFGNDLELQFRRTPRTQGNKSYNRHSSIKLPISPLWFLKLQKRFYSYWLTHFQLVQNKNNRNAIPLLMINTYSYSGRPLRQNYICSMVSKGTQLATGNVVPYRILRQTCGHLQTHSGDASALSRLGWSAAYSFNYTWMPRIYYTPKSKTQEAVE